jgi:hypothetical protein
MTGWSVRWQSGSPSRSFHSGAQQSGGRSLLPRSQGKTAATNPGGYCCSHWRRNWIPSSDPVLYPPASAQDVQPAAGVDGKSVEHGRQVAGEVGDAAGGRVVYLDPALDLAEEVVAYVIVRELGPGWVVERSRRDHGARPVMDCSSRSQTSVLPG